MTIVLSLPVPPSTNNLFATYRGRRIKSERYIKWTEAAGWLLNKQRPGKIVGPYRLSIIVPVTTKGDISNRIKAIEDLLVAHAVTEDDSLAQAVSIRRDAIAVEAIINLESA